MLFHSLQFIFLFLPVVLLLYTLLVKLKWIAANTVFLLAASLVFYGVWSNYYLLLLCISIVLNFFLGRRISGDDQYKKLYLYLGILLNVGSLAYFKYLDFSIEILNAVFDWNIALQRVLLPVGISFFSFTQLAYLVDCYQQKVPRYTFIEYALFVTFFPHAIAGPIIHHKEMMPQLMNQLNAVRNIKWEEGISLFILGLSKKLLLADQFGVFADRYYNAVATPDLTALDAWVGVISYALQIYFDFSGYSDMALGLGLFFGIYFPLNFDSPYKSKSIIEFWRTWHVTLSKFLRDYLYIPLGGNRHGSLRRYANLMITMLLGGLWHGAQITFVVWGVVHGVYLIINHYFLYLRERYSRNGLITLLQRPTIAWGVTMLAVILAWIPFRASTLGDTWLTLKRLCQVNTLGGAQLYQLFEFSKFDYPLTAAQTRSLLDSKYLSLEFWPLEVYAWSIGPFYWIVLGMIVALVFPSTMELFGFVARRTRLPFVWRKSLVWAIYLGVLLFFSIQKMTQPLNEFIYFQF